MKYLNRRGGTVSSILCLVRIVPMWADLSAVVKVLETMRAEDPCLQKVPRSLMSPEGARNISPDGLRSGSTERAPASAVRGSIS
jgi:hypothetical protein